jgi:hypothetical protein
MNRFVIAFAVVCMAALANAGDKKETKEELVTAEGNYYGGLGGGYGGGGYGGGYGGGHGGGYGGGGLGGKKKISD